MNMFGIDISLVPWPVFLLLVVVIIVTVWYLNVYMPLSDSYDSLKTEENENIKSLKEEVKKLIDSVIEIRSTVGQHHIDNTEIINSLDDIEKYASSLNDVSKFLNDKDRIIENKVDQIDVRIDELYKSIDEIKKMTSSKKTKGSIK